MARVCAPIIVKNQTTNQIMWEVSYAFCLLRQEPNNKDYWMRIPLDKFLLDKPRMMTAEDAALMDLWEKDLKEWGQNNCKVK